MKLSYAHVLAAETALSVLDSGHEVLLSGEAVRKVPFNLGVVRLKLVRNLRHLRRAHKDFLAARDAIIREITGVVEGPAQIDFDNVKHREAWNARLAEVLVTEIEVPIEPFSVSELALDVNPIPFEGVLEVLSEVGVVNFDS